MIISDEKKNIADNKVKVNGESLKIYVYFPFNSNLECEHSDDICIGIAKILHFARTIRLL